MKSHLSKPRTTSSGSHFTGLDLLTQPLLMSDKNIGWLSLKYDIAFDVNIAPSNDFTPLQSSVHVCDICQSFPGRGHQSLLRAKMKNLLPRANSISVKLVKSIAKVTLQSFLSSQSSRRSSLAIFVSLEPITDDWCPPGRIAFVLRTDGREKSKANIFQYRGISNCCSLHHVYMGQRD